MNSSFYNGVSGMKTYQFGIDVWADNIANVNTVGAKTNIPEFSNVFATALDTSTLTNPTANDKGLGSRIGATHLQFNQGSVTKTENPFDMAINGEGWFGLVDQTGEQIFTRAGLFHKDADGFLVDPNGNHLLGTSANNIEDNSIKANYNEDVDLTTPKTQTKIQLPDNLVFPPKPTSKIDFKGALNIKPIYETGFNGEKTEIPNKDKFVTNIINADGSRGYVEVNLTKVVPQAKDSTTWNADVNLLDEDKNIISSKKGVLDFNSRGALTNSTIDSIDNNGTPISLNFGSIYDPNKNNSGFDGLFSFNGTTNDFARSVTQDGKESGELKEYGMNKDGVIEAIFTNGKAIPVSKVALYHFQNKAGLEQSSPVYFKNTANSGEPMFFKDKDGKTINTATISSYALESANISMTTALTELIIMQKAYDASAKSITTSDQLIQNAINMKK